MLPHKRELPNLKRDADQKPLGTNEATMFL